LPYRIEASAGDAPVSILLVTSRDTKRWVIPKGNVGAGQSPHAAAAEEAEEEAGVRGAVSKKPLGSYCYGKRLANGDWVVIDVDVFPLVVDKEMAKWKEQGQRERKWFSLDEAASAVEEPDLRGLILSFGKQLQSGKHGR
jgi:8-oxo-dGTP pyrophosphatase MutT (NUDIX family)